MSPVDPVARANVEGLEKLFEAHQKFLNNHVEHLYAFTSKVERRLWMLTVLFLGTIVCMISQIVLFVVFGINGN